MRRCLFLLVVLLFVQTALAQNVKLSPPQKVGNSVVRVAFTPTDLEWLVEQKYFLIDNRRVALPPASLGYHRTFSTPRWITHGGRIAALKYWQFDTAKSLRRTVTLAFPSYRVLSRGPWIASPGGDTIPDPPR